MVRKKWSLGDTRCMVAQWSKCHSSAGRLHLHLRRGAILRSVLRFTEQQFARALVMPNVNPPVVTSNDVEEYRAEIRAVQRGTFER